MSKSERQICAVRVAAGEMAMRPIGELVPYANNAKVHTPEQLSAIRASLREFGFVSPVLVDGAGNIIAGHGRVAAARAEGMTEVPCVQVEGLTEAQRKAYILADNRLSEMGGWDAPMLRIELEGLQELQFDTGLTGFDMEKVRAIDVSAHQRERSVSEGGHFWGDEEGESNEEYEAFTEKFKPKLTTDDCYTPENIYGAVRDWAVERYGLKGREIVRPFFPGGDYRNHAYPEGCVVLDNPPFSILSEICRFYQEAGIAFFLFAPALTLYSVAGGSCRYVHCGVGVTYENGAVVPTSFVTNLGDCKVELAPALYGAVFEENRKNEKEQAAELPGYAYPVQLMRTADYTLAKYGQALQIRDSDCVFVRALDAQREKGKAIFGGGFLLSEKAAAEKAAAEKAAAEKAAAVKWELSQRELALIRSMSDEGGA